jgi:DNA polymerase elongation subunit (family B)
MLAKAKKLRPSPTSVSRIQILHAEPIDGWPGHLPASQDQIYKDAPYAAICDVPREKGDAKVCVFGVCEKGCSVMVVVNGYKPWIRVEIPEGFKLSDAEKVAKDLERDYRIGQVSVKLENMKRFYGWIPDAQDSTRTRRFSFARFYFKSWNAAKAGQSILNDLRQFTVCEKTVKPAARFLNDLALCPSDWMSLEGAHLLTTDIRRMSHCQLEYSLDVSLVKASTCDLVAPLLVMSFDGEMFSNDGLFPSVLKGDDTVCIGASFLTYGSNFVTRFILMVGDVEVPADTDIHVERYSSTMLMLEGFRDLVIASDPDLITGWNIYGFDFPFLFDNYLKYFSAPDVRGTEALQISAVQEARDALHLPVPTLKHCSSLLAEFRAKNGNHRVNQWISKMEWEVGARHTKALLKQEKSLVGPNLHSFNDEEEEDEVIEPLSASAARHLRASLRVALLGAQEAAKVQPQGFHRILADAEEDERNEFWSRIEFLHGPHIVQMLSEKVPASPAMRGRYFGRLACEPSQLVEKRMSSAAFGDNTYHLITMTGRVHFDLMQWIKNDKKPDDNSLRFAAIHWLSGDISKLDLSPEEMFEAVRSGCPKKKWEVAKYCSMDCEIPLQLLLRLSYIPTCIEMSRVCFTFLQDILVSGQQVKVFNLITRFIWNEFALNIRESGWPKYTADDDDGKRRKPDYQGATVIEPMSGFYDECVTTLDFTSLYPSIITFFNLCPSVLILDEIPANSLIAVERHTITHNIRQRDGSYTKEDRVYSFATNVQGVLPRLLKRLLDARVQVKKQMKQCSDPVQYAILDGRQNGIKVACNSVYGFCGVGEDRGLLPCKPVAAVTTLKGRSFIEAAKTFVEGNYPGSQVIYGDTDSVMVRFGKHVSVEQASHLGQDAAEKITMNLQSGLFEGLGGAGAAAKSLPSGTLLASGLNRSPPRDLVGASRTVSIVFEKTYFPFLLLLKKKYAGIKYTSDGKGGFKSVLEMKGVDPVRRDRSKLVRDVCSDVLQCLLTQRSVEKSLDTLKSTLKTLAEGTRNFEDFVLSKSLKSNYASSNLPHVTAWQRMKDRGDSGLPTIGSRMPFVIVEDSTGNGGRKSKSKLYERSEHPEFVKKSGLRIDKRYYIEVSYA